jgi:hypothetical protein
MVLSQPQSRLFKLVNCKNVKKNFFCSEWVLCWPVLFHRILRKRNILWKQGERVIFTLSFFSSSLVPYYHPKKPSNLVWIPQRVRTICTLPHGAESWIHVMGHCTESIYISAESNHDYSCFCKKPLKEIIFKNNSVTGDYAEERGVNFRNRISSRIRVHIRNCWSSWIRWPRGIVWRKISWECPFTKLAYLWSLLLGYCSISHELRSKDGNPATTCFLLQ